MSTDFHRERKIRRVLKQLARQRLAVILQPGNAWVIEHAINREDGTDEALRTCHLRGWAEPMTERGIPQITLTAQGGLPDDPPPNYTVIYRLTGAGWDVLHRTHVWIVFTSAVALVTLFATLVGLILRSR